MSTRHTATALVCGLLLASCGGGGGDGGGGGTGGTQVGGAATQPVAITESNAKAVAANALDNVLDASATRATGLPVAVQQDAPSAGGAGVLQAISAVAQLAASAVGGSQLPAGVAVSESMACPDGGSITVTGNVASDSAIRAGDNLTVTNNNCRINQAGVVLTLNGQVAISIVSGFISDLPFHVVIESTATNLSVQAGSSTVVSNGDARIDWNATSASSQTLLATGTLLTTRETASGVTRNTALRNYKQGLTISSTLLTGTLSGTIESDSPRLGATGGTYTISTPTAVTWVAGTGLIHSGIVKVVGTNNAQLTLTFTGNNNAVIQIDGTGDGTFETSISTNVTELGALL